MVLTSFVGAVFQATPISPLRAFATPRRLAVSITDVASQAADRQSELTGPSTKAPEQAVAGTELSVLYLGERYPVTVEIAGPAPIFDPENTRIRS